jgi:hypothetical protein
VSLVTRFRAPPSSSIVTFLLPYLPHILAHFFHFSWKHFFCFGLAPAFILSFNSSELLQIIINTFSFLNRFCGKSTGNSLFSFFNSFIFLNFYQILYFLLVFQQNFPFRFQLICLAFHSFSNYRQFALPSFQHNIS